MVTQMKKELKETPSAKASTISTSDTSGYLSLRRATWISVGLHIVGPVVLGLIILLVSLLLFWLFHLNLWDWWKSNQTPHDVEFSLVDDTHALQPKKPLFKSLFNQQAGGPAMKNPAPEPHPETATSPSPKESAKALPSTPTPVSQKSGPKTTDSSHKPHAEPKTTPKPVDMGDTIPQKITPSPSSNNTLTVQSPAPKSTSAQTTIPPNTLTGSTMPIQSQAGAASKAGVDVAQEPDFGPFMAELKRRLSRNWTPPRGEESRKVVLLFYVARDGSVHQIETEQSSGDPNTDQSAIAALEASAPFNELPPQVKEDLLPVEFTFDYNIFSFQNSRRHL